MCDYPAPAARSHDAIDRSLSIPDPLDVMERERKFSLFLFRVMSPPVSVRAGDEIKSLRRMWLACAKSLLVDHFFAG